MESSGRLVLNTQLLAMPFQMAEVNCVPLSEFSCAGTPYLEIQPAMRVSAQVEAVMSRMSRASSQREDLSTTVNSLLHLQGCWRCCPLCERARSLMGCKGGIIDRRRGRPHSVDLWKCIHWRSEPARRGWQFNYVLVSPVCADCAARERLRNAGGGDAARRPGQRVCHHIVRACWISLVNSTM